MKKTVYITGLLLFIISVISCSDDFLLKNNDNLYILSDTLYLNNNQDNVETSVQLPGSVNSDYTVFMQPKWLSFNSMHGIVTGGNVSLSFTILKENITPGYQTQYATIMLDIENTGLFSFIVAYTNTGSPTMQCSSSYLNFELSGSKSFTISNTSEGILKWNITGIPDWLLLSDTSGILYFGNSITITASLDFDNITMEEELLETLQINSNSVAGGFGLTVHVSPTAIIPSEVIKIGGIVTDAEYNHESGIMVICTKSPGSLIIFNTSDNKSNTILLDRTPNCVSLSEDGHKAVIGYSVASVSYIDIDAHEITRDYSIDCIPYDIVLGDNGWCYITPSVDQWVYFRNLNLNTGELIVGKNWSTVYEKTIIKKIQGKPFLVGSRTTVSPSGLLIFDITRGVSSDTISYYHASIGKFWVSGDGTRLYDSYKYVYNLPEYDIQYHSNTPSLYGQIESSFYYITALDECPVINSIFAASTYYDYTTGHQSLIEQFNTSNLNKIKTLNISPVFVTENGIKTLYETNARFLFVNKEGSVIYAIKNLKEHYNKNYWTIETFTVQ